MNQPNYLDYCTDEIEQLFGKYQDSVIKEIVKRIIKYGEITQSSIDQINILQESGLLYDDILSTLSEYSAISEATVIQLFNNVCSQCITYDREIYKRAGTNTAVKVSPAVEQIVNAAIKKTNGNLTNLTMTTAEAGQQKFIDACSIAEMEIATGAVDVNTAIRRAVEYAIQDGVSVNYFDEDSQTVTATRNVVSAVRTAVLTGLSQTTGEVSLQNAKEMGTDVMELSAHLGARPSHSIWQGKLVCISNRNTKYLTLDDIRYGEADGFKGINCRHYWFPFLEGISQRTYTDQELEEMATATVFYNGNEIPIYKANQRQRAMERKIRAERSELVGLNSSVELANKSGNSELAEDLQISFDNLSMKLKGHEAVYKDFCKQTGLPELSERLQYPGFNRSVSRKAYNSAEKHFKEWKSYLPEDIAPKNLANYYDIKYNNKEQYRLLQSEYKQAKQREYIRNNCILTIEEGKQGKHIKTHNNFIEGRSYFTISLEQMQKLVDKYAGTGTIEFYRNGVWRHTEIIGKTDSIIGYTVDPETLEEIATSAFKIHYSNNGTHIVPTREDSD